jgi:glycine dehydrogenase
MVCDLYRATACQCFLLLDEATAAAEAMTMFFFNPLNKEAHTISRPKFFVDEETFPQTIDVVYYPRSAPLV